MLCNKKLRLLEDSMMLEVTEVVRMHHHLHMHADPHQPALMNFFGVKLHKMSSIGPEMP